MSLHYKKDGSLDMRYSSSREYVSSGGSSRGPSAYSSPASSMSSSSYSSYTIQPQPQPQPQFYASPNTSTYTSSSSSHASGSSPLHYKKDGSLDMRYSSSKQIVAASSPSSSTSNVSPNRSQPEFASSSSSHTTGSSQLHYKKDGSLDMRYSSSKQMVSPSSSTSSGSVPLSNSASNSLHLTKDGKLDMRYKSSKDHLANLASKVDNIHIKEALTAVSPFPADVKLTKKGLPDMRYKRSVEYVLSLEQTDPELMKALLPRRKDGSLNQAAARDVCPTLPSHSVLQENERQFRYQTYYPLKFRNDGAFSDCWYQQQHRTVSMPQDTVMADLPTQVHTLSMSSQPGANASDSSDEVDEMKSVLAQIADVNEIPGGDLTKGVILGRGGFGVVYQALWKSKNRDVAFKEMHLTKLTRAERRSFVSEVNLLANVGRHPNIISVYGYCVEPLGIVMELADVKIGSLHHLLHYAEEPEYEAKLVDGRVKKRLLLGIVSGLKQLHLCGIIHRDIKPQNILICTNPETEEWDAKICDFGLAQLRGKSSATVKSTHLSDATDPEKGLAAGTAAYMAPELLAIKEDANQSTDVYSFGILLNELITEEEPYQHMYQKIADRGQFGAALLAKEGFRPRIGTHVPPNVKQLIELCWHENPTKRPSLTEVWKTISDDKFVIPSLEG